MKKLFLMAAAAATLATACQKSPESPVGAEGKTTISVSLAFDNSSATRAVGPWSDNSSTPIISSTLTNGYIYVLDGNQIVYREELTNLTLTASGTERTSTQILGVGMGDGGSTLLFPSTAKVYVLANIPSTISNPANFEDMDDIAAAAATLSAASDYTTPAMGNINATPVELSNFTESGGVKKADARVSINPLFTRVEVKGVAGKGWVSDFNLVGVYLDNYYTGYTMTGGLVSNTLKDNGQDETIGSKSGWFADTASPSPVAWSAATSGDVVGADWTLGALTSKNDAWVYNIAAGNVPRIVIQIEDLKVYPDDGSLAGDQPDNSQPGADPLTGTADDWDFITVKKLKKTDGIELTALERGVIYQIEKIEFDMTNVGAQPNIEDVEVTAIVSVLDWQLQPTQVVFD